MESSLNFDEFQAVSHQQWLQRLKKDLKGQELSVLHSQPAPEIELVPYLAAPNDQKLIPAQEDFQLLLAWPPEFMEDEILMRIADLKSDGIAVPVMAQSPSALHINSYIGKSSSFYGEFSDGSSYLNARHLLNAGLGPINELAITLLALKDFQPSGNSHLLFSVGEHFFLETAKIQVLKALVYEFLEESTNAISFEAINFMACSGLRNKTSRSPEVNILRNTLEVMASFLGGANSMACLPYNALMADQSLEDWLFAGRMVTNIKHLLRDESRFFAVGNSLEGSTAIEHLMDQLAEKSWNRFLELNDEFSSAEELINSAKFEEMLTADRNFYASQMKEERFKLVGSLSFVPVEETSKALPEIPDWLQGIDALPLFNFEREFNS